MEDIARQILLSAVPQNESIKLSDFNSYVRALQTKVVDLFRYSSLQLVPSFISTILRLIDDDLQLRDKKKRQGAAISISMLIDLFPFDDYLPQFRPIVEKLLVPGNKNLVLIGSLVLQKLAKISGPNRDQFLTELVNCQLPNLSPTEPPETRYAAAVVWNAIAQCAPEHLFQMGTSFATYITTTIRNADSTVKDILIESLKHLFHSERASIGSAFLSEAHNLLLYTTTKAFTESNTIEDSILNYKLLAVLLSSPPYIPKRNAVDFILPTCLKDIKGNDSRLVSYATQTVISLSNTGVLPLTEKVFYQIYNILMNRVLKLPHEDCGDLCDLIQISPVNDPAYAQSLVAKIGVILRTMQKTDGPKKAFNLSVAAVSNKNFYRHAFYFVNNLSVILGLSKTYLPVQNLLVALNANVPRWTKTHLLFKNALVNVLKHELHQTLNTDRIVLAMKSLLEFNGIAENDANDFAVIVYKLKNSPDSEVRELVIKVMLHIFKYTDSFEKLSVFRSLVEFAVADYVTRVRLQSVKALRENPEFIGQSDVFNIFVTFLSDENVQIRKIALSIITNLKTPNISFIRVKLLSSFQILKPQFNSPVWEIFPNLISAAAPIIHLYAEPISTRFLKFLEKRFGVEEAKDKSVIFMKSAIYREVDASLIKSVSKLFLLCPEKVDINKFIQITENILRLPIHPFTKTVTLKVLKNVSKVYDGITPSLYRQLVKIVIQKQSQKMVTKALKLLGVFHPQYERSPKYVVWRSTFNDPICHQRAFVEDLFEHLLKSFVNVDVDSQRISIVKTFATIFEHDSTAIQSYLGSILGLVLNFISKNDSLPLYAPLLCEIIEAASTQVTPYTEMVYKSLEAQFHNQYTSEASRVFASLVVATNGQCTSLINSVLSVAFILLRTKKENDLFLLLRVIAQFNSSFLETILNGISELIMLQTLVEQAIDTIEFILSFCSYRLVEGPIRRALYTVTQRCQPRYRDRATFLINCMKEKPGIGVSEINDSSTITTDTNQFEATTFVSILKELLKESYPNPNQINEWYLKLEKFLIKRSPSKVIQAVTRLDYIPDYVFKAAFIDAFQNSTNFHNKIGRIINKLLPLIQNNDKVIEQFLLLFEFAAISEIDLGVDPKTVAQIALEKKFYSIARLFADFASMKPLQAEVDYMITGTRSVTNDPEMLMKMGDYEKALPLLGERDDSQKIICHAKLHQWEEVSKMESSYNSLSFLSKSDTAKYFSLAAFKQGRIEESKAFMNETNGYSVEDCIQKAIISLGKDQIDEARDAIHFGWRYLSATTSNIPKRNSFLIGESIHYAEQLNLLSELIHCIGKDSIPFDTMYQKRIKEHKNDPNKILQFSLIHDLLQTQTQSTKPKPDKAKIALLFKQSFAGASDPPWEQLKLFITEKNDASYLNYIYRSLSLGKGDFWENFDLSFYSQNFEILYDLADNEIANQILQRLILEFPLKVNFSIFRRGRKDLLEYFRKTHPVHTAHTELFYEGLIKIINTSPDVILDKFESIMKTGNTSSLNRFEEEVWKQFSKQITEKNELPRKSIKKYIESLLLVPLSHVDLQLAHKRNWSISIPSNLDVQVSHFLPSIHKLDNGFSFQIMGRNGKKYNYSLEKDFETPQRQSFDFATLLKVNRRFSMFLTENLVLRGQNKGFITVYEFIRAYQNTKKRNTDNEYAEAIEGGNKVDESNELKNALITTSKDSLQWIKRSKEFSESYGKCSAFSYVFGKIDTSPFTLLISKLTGTLRVDRFMLSGDTYPVPFRATKMFKTALGVNGFEGLFKMKFNETLKSIRKYENVIGATLQFYVESEFQKPLYPKEYIDGEGSECLDKIFGRVRKTDGEDEFHRLIEAAENEENIAQMPQNWVSWW